MQLARFLSRALDAGMIVGMAGSNNLRNVRALAPAIRESDDLADQIAELSAHLDAATHSFLTLIRRFDELRGWGVQGATSCAGWLLWRIGLSRGAAREHLRVADAVAALPQIDLSRWDGRRPDYHEIVGCLAART